MASPEKLDELRSRLRTAYIQKNERTIVLPDGSMGSWTYDLRPIALDNTSLDLICGALCDKLETEFPFQIGGLETASITLIAGILMKLKERGKHATGFYIRKSRRKDGLQQQIEGNLTNERIVLVDDVLNSGRSFMRQIQALEDAGKKVHAIAVLVRYRDESFYEEFRSRGIKIFSVFTLDDFPESGGLKEYADKHPVAPPHQPFSIEWKFESENPAYYMVVPKSAPTIDDKHVYFGADNGVLWALNQSDGAVAWNFKTLFGAGMKRIFSSPAVSKGTVYFGAYDGNFYALNAETGKKEWVFFDADWVGSSPCVAENLNLIFVGLEFGLWKKQGALVALDAKTGTKKWQQTIETLVHSSPAYSKRFGVVVVGSSEGKIYACNAKTGKELWTFAAGGAVRAGFAFDEKRGQVCFGSEDKYIYVLRIETGEVVYTIETLEPVYSTPLVHNDRLYFGVLDKRMYCISLRTGEILWSYWTHARVFSTPIVIEGHLFFGSNDGRLYELDAVTGKEIGYFQSSERIVNKIAYNPNTKRFFVPTYANQIYCLVKNLKK